LLSFASITKKNNNKFFQITTKPYTCTIIPTSILLPLGE
jgi:hypothetical protein